MRTPLELGEIAAPRLPAGSRRLVIASLCIGLSVLYQVYFFGFEEGEITGGGIQRLAFKVLAAGLLVVGLRRYLSFSAFTLNLLLKLPILFIAASVFLLSPFLEGAYAQALNLLFFLPVLLVDWNKAGAERLYRLIWGVITVVVIIQLALDPLLKFHFQVGWSNAAVIGGMGNPNVFGLFLIGAGLACALLLPKSFRFVSTILFLSTILTGSLASALVGFGFAFLQLLYLMARSPSKTLVAVCALIAAVSASTVVVDLVSDSPSITHAFNKFVGVSDLVSGGGGGQSESIAVRMDYTRRGLQLMAASPLSVVTGHPGGVVMYSGDGMWLAMLVTYGLPVTLLFLVVNLVVLYRAIRLRSPDMLFSAGVVAAFMAFLATNRILDYWPAALIYLLAFSYLTNRGVRPHSRARRARPAEQAPPSI